jgi:ribonucleoside-diphosphate reductase alpha chain
MWASLNLVIKRVFSDPGLSVFETTPWKSVDVEIIGADGKVVYSATGVEAPESWSQIAIDVAVNKYFRKAGLPKSHSNSGKETSVKQLIRRVVEHIALVAKQKSYFDTKEALETFCEELRAILVSQMGAFNSPVWFNCGLSPLYGVFAKGQNYTYDPKTQRSLLVENAYEKPQTSACFIQSVSDSLADIFELVKKESKVFKYGSGTGTNFSTIRGRQESLAGGGESSGLISFLEVLDKGAGATKSGGVTRRAAKMVCLDLDHPEIFDFVWWKAKEEKKAKALIASGFDGRFDGEAYRSVSGQNSNNSVRVTDEFLTVLAKGGVWQTKARTTGEVVDEFAAEELWHAITQAAWECADPGVQFHDNIQQWNTCKALGEINASNPCSEYMFLNESACNLASVNLVKFLQADGNFDFAGFQQCCRVLFVAQDILVDLSSYPTQEIAENAYKLRPLGLGFSNLGALCMRKGLVYGDHQSVELCKRITAVMQASAIEASIDLAAAEEPFLNFKKCKDDVLSVLKLHRDAVVEAESVQAQDQKTLSFWSEQRQTWDKLIERAEQLGVRNSQWTLIAPTGTIGLLMDCDTLGIEPEFSLMKTKSLAGGGVLTLINQSVEPALVAMGLPSESVNQALAYLQTHRNFDGCPVLTPEQIRVFWTAVPTSTGGPMLPWRNHLNMMAAAQPFLSGAISKTVNLPAETEPEQISEIYLEAHRLGLKSVAIYREGSKGSQPLNVKSIDDEIAKSQV